MAKKTPKKSATKRSLSFNRSLPKTTPNKKSSRSKSRTKRGFCQKSLVVNTQSKVTIAPKVAAPNEPGKALSMGPGANGVGAPPGIFGEQSQQIQCPQCTAQVLTQTTPTVGICTYLLCLVALPCCCCCIPFFLDYTKDVEHRCPTCGYFFGKYSRLTL